MKAGRSVTALIEATKEIMPSDWIPPISPLQSFQQWRAEKKIAATIAANSIERRDKGLKDRIRELDQSNGPANRETATILRRLKGRGPEALMEKIENSSPNNAATRSHKARNPAAT